MGGVGTALSLTADRGVTASRSRRRVPRAAAVFFTAVALLSSLAGCAATAPEILAERAARSESLLSAIQGGLNLYAAGEFRHAAQRFRQASAEAIRIGTRRLEREVLAAECMTWMQARALSEFAQCANRLNRQRDREVVDPGVNTLIALGCIAGGTSPSSLPVPRSVLPIIRAAGEGPS